MTDNKNKVAIIMAGGLGARLWPKSTEKNPKQFVYLLDEGTMIQNTVDRLLGFFDPEDIYIVCTSLHHTLLTEQVSKLAHENIIIEPFGRNTASCIALTAVLLGKKYSPNTVIFSFPSDHVIYNKGEFYQSLETAFNTAYQADRIVTIGIQPSRPETGYGYIQIKNDEIPDSELHSQGVRATTTFAEKPDIATAQRFIESGDFLWNSGICIWSFSTFWSALDKYMKEISIYFRQLESSIGKESFNKEIEIIYRQIPDISIDFGILEKADNVFVVQSSFRWSDVGNWDEVYRLSMKDARNNVIIGDVISVNNNNCFVSASERIIGIVGVKDLIVIDSEDSLLVCKRGHSEEVKSITDYMRRKHINKF
ncbi:MAG: sugar phosphate nucleotidyltransferase [Candidatus Kapabacteria bacterium]|nr:sugar phosphate nucleotidyltransferase [Candidatus Kapabacteria bacterium]